jgi:hypothetical protein
MRTNFERLVRVAAITITAAASVLIPLWLLGVHPQSPEASTAHAAQAPDSTLAAVHAPAPRRVVKRAEVFVVPRSAPAFGTPVHARTPPRPQRPVTATVRAAAPVSVHRAPATPGPHRPAVVTVGELPTPVSPAPATIAPPEAPARTTRPTETDASTKASTARGKEARPKEQKAEPQTKAKQELSKPKALKTPAATGSDGSKSGNAGGKPDESGKKDEAGKADSRGHADKHGHDG